MSAVFRPVHLFFLATGLAALMMLTACAPLVVGGTAATTAIIATDRRTTGEQVEDRAIEFKIASEMRRLFDDAARVNVTSYAGRVLLTGEIPDEAGKKRATEAAQQVEQVKEVFNETRVGEKRPIGERTQDTWITSKVKSALIKTKDVPTRTMIVTTDHGVVYLLGRVTEDESKRAAIVASSTPGVKKVIKAFDIVSAESLIPARDQEIEQEAARKSADAEGTKDPDAMFADNHDETVESIPLDD